MRCLALLLMMVGCPALYAGGFQISLQGVKQTGMAHTGVANPLDATALYFNPGSLSFTRKNSLSLNAVMILPTVQFKEEGTNNLYRTDAGAKFPFSGYWSWSPKPNQPGKIGVGVYTPFGSSVDWGNTWAGRYVLTSTKLSTIHIQPTFSYNIKDRVGIGAGFVYGRGSVELARSLPVTLASGRDAEARLSGKAGGYGFNAGVLVRISKKLDVGVSYKSGIKYKANNGKARFMVPTALRDSFPDTDISTTLNTPWLLDMGITYRPEPRLAISLDVNYVGWSVYDTVAVDFHQNTSVLQDLYLPRNFKNAVTIRLGGSYDIDGTFTIRAGTYLDLNPVQDGFVSPETPDADRFAITLGASMRSSDRFELDVSITYLEGVGRVEQQSENYANLCGTYRGRAFTIGLALNFNLAKKEKPLTPETPLAP
ncbi:outer membrane protein transport protein [soil metagenome]